MTRFSASGDEEEEDREGPSSPRYKRFRSYFFYSSESEDDYAPQPSEPVREDEEEEAVDVEGVEEECYEDEDEGEEGLVFSPPCSAPAAAPTDGSSVATNIDDKSISVVLTDPDVLDCFICFEPLSLPVFQVINFLFHFSQLILELCSNYCFFFLFMIIMGVWRNYLEVLGITVIDSCDKL